MTEANFSFISDATGGDKFTVVSFTGNEAISTLYQYELEIKSPLAAATNLDDLLDSPARFVTETNGQEYPVYGVLSSINELRTVQGYVYYQAVLVPRLWWLSTYKTNEIYTEEKTVDEVIQTVLENAGFSSDADFDLIELDNRDFLERDYRCQFGESDFDFISRLMENEGIFYYFDHSGDAEKIIFINDMNLMNIPQPGLIFDVAAQTSRQHDSINAWSCRKQRLPASVSVRDYNPVQPSLDIFGDESIDQMGQGTEYLYGENIINKYEADHLAGIRAEERLCQKTRYYGESSVTRLQSGYLFGLGGHPNDIYNGIEYLTVEVSHEGLHLDMSVSSGSGTSKNTPQYRNSFVAIEASEQFRPARVTHKPRFYGTMTAFVYAEAITGRGIAEVDEQGRYRVHLPFDRADGTKDSSDPHRKASTWIRMAQPYVGKDEGMYFPLEGGTEILLTFLNGDPDLPIISAALPNASTPSLLNNSNAHVSTIKTPGALAFKASSGSYINKTSPQSGGANSASASAPNNPYNNSTQPFKWRDYERAYAASQDQADDQKDATDVLEGSALTSVYGYGPDEALYQKSEDGSSSGSFLFHSVPVSDGTEESNVANYPFTKLNDFGMAMFEDEENTTRPATDANTKWQDDQEEENAGSHIDRSSGQTYVHKIGSTFPYPEQERVYFFGTFHEDFHMDDLGISGWQRPRDFVSGGIKSVLPETKSEANKYYRSVDPTKKLDHPGGLGKEVFHFPVPGGDGDQTNPANFPKNRRRGVSEDKRWGDQMNYAWGRSFNWGGGPKGGSFAEYNYGNSYTENLMTETASTAGTSDNMTVSEKAHADDYAVYSQFSGVGLASAAIEKTWGSVYSYQNGFSLDIKVGTSHEFVYGDAISHVEGAHSSTHLGATNEFFVGAKNELALNHTNSVTGLTATEVFLGAKAEVCAGASAEAYFGAKAEAYFGAKAEAFLGASAEAHIGPSAEYCDSMKTELIKGVVLSKSSVVTVNLGPTNEEIQSWGGTIKNEKLAHLSNAQIKFIQSKLVVI